MLWLRYTNTLLLTSLYLNLCFSHWQLANVLVPVKLIGLNCLGYPCIYFLILIISKFIVSTSIILLIIWFLGIQYFFLRYIADPYLPIPEVIVGTVPFLQELRVEVFCQLPLRLQSQRLPWSLPSQSWSAECWGKSRIAPSQGLSRINDK